MERVLPDINPVPVFQEGLQESKEKKRIASYDVARALAVVGMVIVNYHSIFQAGNSGAGERLEMSYAVHPGTDR